MASDISSYFSTAPPSSWFEAPSEIQRPADFESTRTEPVQTEEAPIVSGLKLSRVPGFELANSRKRLRSFIWTHGYRVFSTTGNVLIPSRRRFGVEVMQWLLCLQ
jgi:hypothetical protein